jgi:guanylate kinase
MPDRPKGKVILVAGLHGAGKSTLIRAALEKLPELSNIKTYTTREPRQSEREHGSQEYIFVNQAEYDRLKKKPGWDHSERRGTCYGSDAAWVNKMKSVLPGW